VTVDVTSGQTALVSLRKWLETAQISANELARRCSSDSIKFYARQITRLIDENKKPSPQLAAALARVTGVEVAAWDEAPESGKRASAELPELKGSPAERARTLETWLESRARSGDGLSLDIDRSVRALLSSIQAQVRAKPIPDLHEHPDFEAFFDLILGALAKHPGAAKAVVGALKARLSTEAEAA
jgi:hypothetical protein